MHRECGLAVVFVSVIFSDLSTILLIKPVFIVIVDVSVYRATD